MGLESALSEELALLATIDPVSAAAGTTATDVIDMKYWERVLFVLSLGAMATGSTVDFVVQRSATNWGSATTVRSITQLTQAGTDANKQVIVEVRAAELSEQRYIRGLLTVGTDASLVSVVALGKGRVAPVSGVDLASVDEIKNS